MEEGYYKTKESVNEYIQLAKGINGQALIEKLKAYLHKKGTILELGSGPGADWKILNKSFEVTGSDNSLEFLKYLRANNPDHHFLELDAVTLETEQYFDGIYSNKVLHHLNDEELKESLVQQNAILNDDGVICHTFWKGEGSEVFKGLFVNYHEEEDLKNFFEQHFEILLLESYPEFEDEDSLLLIAKKRGKA